MGRTGLKPTLGKPPICCKESKLEREVLLKKKNRTTLLSTNVGWLLLFLNNHWIGFFIKRIWDHIGYQYQYQNNWVSSSLSKNWIITIGHRFANNPRFGWVFGWILYFVWKDENAFVGGWGTLLFLHFLLLEFLEF